MTTSATLTVVTYHYVRPVAGSAHPRLSALELDRFKRQIDGLARSVRFVDIEQVARWAVDGTPLPERPTLLTFDDGYIDHFEHVRPALLERGLPAVFFLPGAAIAERRALDANLIQFLLASGVAVDDLVCQIEGALLDRGFDRGQLDELRSAGWRPVFFDDAPTSYVKRMLQHAVPDPLRSELLDHLFRSHVTSDVEGFADALYLRLDQAERLLDDGFHLGGHGWSHCRLSQQPVRAVDDEIERSLALMDRLDPERGRLAFCYPYGDLSESAVDALSRQRVSTAFTVESRLARTDDHPLRLPRIDTNTLANSTMMFDPPASG